MKYLAVSALASALFLAPAASASALTITLNHCEGVGECDFFGGTVDFTLSLIPAGTGFDLQIVATNNLTSGAVGRLGFNFDPPVGFLQNFHPAVVSTSSSGGNGVSFNNLQFFNSVGPFLVDVGFGGLDTSSNAGSWAPGESITVVLSTDPDLNNFLPNVAGYAWVFGAGGPQSLGGPASFLLTGVTTPDPPPTVPVPEPATILLLATGLAAAIRSRSRARR